LWFQLAHYCLRPWILVAFAALAMYPELRQNYLADPQFDPGKGFPMVIRDLAPSGLRGLMMVTFFAAFMSTISTQLNWGASYLVKDVYQRFVRPNASDRHYGRVSRVASVLVLVCGAAATWLMKDYSIDRIWNILLALGAGTGSVLMLRWFWWRINAWSEIVAMLASLMFFLLIGVEQKSLPTEVWVVETPQVKILIVAVLSIATWLLGTFLTPAESAEKLVSFYGKIRPAGPGWKPIAKQCPGIEVTQDLGLSIFAAMADSLLIYSVLPLTGFLVFGHYREAAWCSLVAIISGAITFAMVRHLATSSDQP
jgi:Na+/proline symporter